MESSIAPKRNEVMAHFKFFTRSQQHAENMNTWLRELRLLISRCDFGTIEEKILRTQIVLGINNAELQEKLLQADADLSGTINIIHAHEAGVYHRGELLDGQKNGSYLLPTVNEVTSITKNEKIEFNTKFSPSAQSSFTDNTPQSHSNCYNCGRSHEINRCPAFDPSEKTYQSIQFEVKEDVEVLNVTIKKECIEEDYGLNQKSRGKIKVKEEFEVLDATCKEECIQEICAKGLCQKSCGTMTDKEGFEVRSATIKEECADDLGRAGKKIYDESSSQQIKIEHSIAYYSCSKCNFTTTNQTNLSRHSVTVHNKVSFNCELCKYSCLSESCLTKHKIAMHTADMKYTCQFCKHSDSNKESLKKHTINCPEKYIFHCAECEMKYKTKAVLKQHIVRKHINCHRFKCSKCNYTSLVQWELKHHIQTYHDKITLYCDKCKYSTHNVRNLKSHQRIHGNARYRCHQCKYSTKIHSSLKNHIMVHHDNIRFICATCPKSFTHKNMLKRHIEAIHLKRCHFACSKCKFTTVYKESLARHTASVHDRIRIKCNMCNYSARSQRSVSKHKKAVH